MAVPTDDLTEHLLEKVALSRLKGITAVEFENEVHDFYGNKNKAVANDEEKITVDEKLIESAFERLCQHEDVEILPEHDDEDVDQQTTYSTALQSQLAGKRIFTSEEQLWQTIAGHGINPELIPKMEFRLLVIIAQHGVNGVLQSALTALSGQDKHSVPARTTRLANKNYITKSVVNANGTRTSLLRLSKWNDIEPPSELTNDLIDYNALFDATISLLQDNDNIISMEDLCAGAGAESKSKRKVLLKSCMRLSEVGCTRLLRCRVTDEEGNPVMIPGKDKEMTTRAVQLLREPTIEDRDVWVHYRMPRVGNRRSKKAVSNEDSGDDDESDAADNDARDVEGEIDYNATGTPASKSRSRRRTDTNSSPDITPSRKSTRVRRKSSLAKKVDYAELLKDAEEDSDLDAESEVTESASPEMPRRPVPKPTVEVPPPTTALPQTIPRRRRKPSAVDSSNKASSGRRPFGRPRKMAKNPLITHPGGGNFSMFVVEQPVPTATAAVGTSTIDGAPTSSKRERKKSTKALEAEALRAAGEPLLTEPVNGYDMTANNVDFHMYTPKASRAARTRMVDPVDVDDDHTDAAELDMTEAGQTPNPETKSTTKRPYKRRESGQNGENVVRTKRDTPVIKKREVPQEEYDEYDKYAQAAAERQVRMEMKAGGKRTATMAQLDDPAEHSNKAPRTEEPSVAEGSSDDPFTAGSDMTTPANDLPADRVAEVKAAIIAREKPGVYINPPGARNLKLENFVQRGRPRNALIAVFRSERLRDLHWFQEDGPRFAPKSSRRRTDRIGEGLIVFGQDKSPVFVDGNGSEVEDRTPKRRRLEGQATVDTEVQSSRHGEPGALGTRDSAGGGGDAQSEIEAHEETPTKKTTLRRTSRTVRRPSTGFSIAPTQSSSPPAFDEEDGDDDADEQPTPTAQRRKKGPSKPSPSAAELELGALQRKLGRPRKQDTIRIAVLRRQIEAEAAARKDVPSIPAAATSTTGASEPLDTVQGNAKSTSANNVLAVHEPTSVQPTVAAATAATTFGKFPFERRDESDQLDSGMPTANDTNSAEHVAKEPEIAALVVPPQPSEFEKAASPNPDPSGLEQASVPETAFEPSEQPEALNHLARSASGPAEQGFVLEDIATPSELQDAPTSTAQSIPSAPEQEATAELPGPSEVVYDTPQAELHVLRGLRGKKKTPEILDRINTLQAQIDDAYTNGPGTLEELTALRSRRGRRPAFVVARIAVLEKQFPDAVNKSTRPQRASLIPPTPADGDPESGDGSVRRDDRQSTVVQQNQVLDGESGPSSAPAAKPQGLTTMQAPAVSNTEAGKLQTSQHAMMLSVQAPTSSLGNLNALPTTASVNQTKTGVADGKARNQRVVAGPTAESEVAEAVAAKTAVKHPDPPLGAVGTPPHIVGISASPGSHRITTGPQLFSKQYVDSHPEEHFHYRGGGKFALGERFTQAYVDQHPLEKFHQVEDVRKAVRYARGSPPPSEQTQPQHSKESAAAQPRIEPEASQPLSGPRRPASVSAELTQPVIEAAAPSPPSGDVIPADTIQHSEPASISQRPTQAIADSPTTTTGEKSIAADGSERFDKAYVAAHPEEHFYHRGNGFYSRGESVTKAYADAHPEEQFKFIGRQYIRLPGPKTLTPVGEQPGILSPSRQVAYSNSDETSSRRGKGRRQSGLPPSGSKPSTSSRRPVAQSDESIPLRTPMKTPMSSLLTIYKPYSPQIAQSVGPSSVIATPSRGTRAARRIVEQEAAAAVAEGDAAMTDPVVVLDDIERAEVPSRGVSEDIIMEDDAGGDRFDLPGKAAENDDDGQHISPDGSDWEELAVSAHASGTRKYIEPQPASYFPVDLTAAVVVRRSAPTEVRKPPRPKVPYAPRVRDYRSGYGDASSRRTPARGSKMSREMHSDAFGRVEAAALLMHPPQSFHPATGTFTTIATVLEPKPTGRRALRNRDTLARLPQTLDDDFCETPGLIVKLKVKNLASVIPPGTAIESGLSSRDAASDAVPISRVTGKPKRAYKSRPKKVTFDVDNSDEFQDEGEVEEDDSEVEFDDSEEDIAATRPERRKGSKGVNGELRFRDMASGPAFKDADRLVIAFALVSAVCGGLRVEGINWTLIAHALGFRYDGTFLRRRWDHLKRTRKVDVDRLREAIHEPFLAAYEDDAFPRIDFQNLNNTDWPALFDWVQTTVVPHVELQPRVEGPKVPGLLQSREETAELYKIEEPANLHEVRLDEYFVTGTDYNRRNLINRYTYGNALPGELRPKDHLPEDMMVLKSWTRAVAATKQHNYHAEAAAQKLRKFRPDMLQKATADMIEARILSQDRKNRILPGRNYIISNECLQQFRRWPPRPDEFRFLRFVAQAWKNINAHFQSNDQLSLVPSASDPEYLVLLNMTAQGMLKISTVYPEVKQDYDAPFPKLSPWGYCGPTYETKKVDMSRLKFPIVYTKTAAYKDDHELLNHVPIPLHPPEVEGELGLRHPFWVDIHGNLIDDIWDMVLRSILHVLVFRSGSTTTMIEQAHGRKLWAWEIEMALEWMGEVGIAERVGAGVVRDGVWSGGWRAGEWWFCAFAPEVAVWQAPAVAELD